MSQEVSAPPRTRSRAGIQTTIFIWTCLLSLLCPPVFVFILLEALTLKDLPRGLRMIAPPVMGVAAILVAFFYFTSVTIVTG